MCVAVVYIYRDLNSMARSNDSLCFKLVIVKWCDLLRRRSIGYLSEDLQGVGSKVLNKIGVKFGKYFFERNHLKDILETGL